MTDYYLLGPDGETPEPFDIGPNMERVGQWAQRWEPQRQLAADPLPCGGRVSTIFLGLNHQFWGDGPPVLFETMAFGANGKDVFQHRETTKRRALKTHAQVLAHVMEKAAR